VHSKIVTILFVFLFVVPGSQSVSQDPVKTTELTSEQIYQTKCAMCHDKPTGRIPPRAQIVKRSNEDIIQSLTTGSMKQWAEGFSAAQISALASYLTGKQSGSSAQPGTHQNQCKEPAGPINLKEPLWNGWGRDLDNTRYQPKPGIKPEDIPRLKVKWAWTHPGPMATGQPTIIGDRLFVTTEAGQLFSLNAQTGCTYWNVNTSAGLRSSVSLGPLPAGSKAKFAIYFGDQKSNVTALDAETGELLWKTKVEDHLMSRITGSPVLYRDRLFVPVSSVEEVTGRDAKYPCCKFRGSLVSLDAYTGKLLWKSFTVQEEPKPFKINSAGTQMFGPAGGAIWSAPTLDLKRKVVYVATGNSYTDVPTAHSDAIIAFDMETGKLKWVNQVQLEPIFWWGVVNRASVTVRKMPGLITIWQFTGYSQSARRQTNNPGRSSHGVIYRLDPDHQGKRLWRNKG
jgi:polyvinyl alcohol dehydrogenase (cytochrome)